MKNEIDLENMDLDQIQALLAKAHAVADKKREKEKAVVIEDIKAKIKKYEMTSSELGFDTVKESTKRTKSSIALKPMYRSPDGKTWVGRGIAPDWIGKKGRADYEPNKQQYKIGQDGKTQYEQDK